MEGLDKRRLTEGEAMRAKNTGEWKDALTGSGGM